jgi:hypothetical protein
MADALTSTRGGSSDSAMARTSRRVLSMRLLRMRRLTSAFQRWPKIGSPTRFTTPS